MTALYDDESNLQGSIEAYAIRKTLLFGVARLRYSVRTSNAEGRFKTFAHLLLDLL